MKPPADGWDREEQDALAPLEQELEAVRARHASDPPLNVLRAAKADALPEPLQEKATDYLAASQWSRTLIEGLDGLDEGTRPLGTAEQARLLSRIQREAGSGAPRRSILSIFWTQPWFAAAAAVVFVATGTWAVLNLMSRPDAPVPLPEQTVAVATPPAAAPPVFYLPLDKPDAKVSPGTLRYRSAATENPLLTDLKPAFDAFRGGDYAAADQAFSALAVRYPKAVEVFFYQGVSRLLLNNPTGAIASLTSAEKVADAAFAWDVAWYRAVAEERAGNLAGARTRLATLCKRADTRAPQACEALTRIPEGK
jgi:hypothetical protein